MQTCFPHFNTHYCEAVFRCMFDTNPHVLVVWWPVHRYFDCFFQTPETGLRSRSSNRVVAAALSKKLIFTYRDGSGVVATQLSQRKRLAVNSCSGAHMCIRLLSVFATSTYIICMHTLTAQIFCKYLNFEGENVISSCQLHQISSKEYHILCKM